MTFLTVEAISRCNWRGCLCFCARFLFHDGAVAGKDEDHLAAVVVSVHADGSAWNQHSLENTVSSVKEHISGKLLLATLEIRKDSYVHLAEIDYHDGRKELIHGNKELITIEGGINYWGHQHIRQIEQFYKACLKQEPLQISGRVALNTHKLIFAIYDQGKKYIKK